VLAAPLRQLGAHVVWRAHVGARGRSSRGSARCSVAVAAGAIAAILALYVLLPRLAGLDETWAGSVTATRPGSRLRACWRRAPTRAT
jgi:hypothetical protein